ncbi:MAG: hypothetical protein WD066_18060 [Planctomycetaceae bacterium]
MKRRVRSSFAALLGCGFVVTNLTGCLLQGTVGGQTLPSAYYLQDDVQYFPAGPEFKLTNAVNAYDEYRAEQALIQEGFAP